MQLDQASSPIGLPLSPCDSLTGPPLSTPTRDSSIMFCHMRFVAWYLLVALCCTLTLYGQNAQGRVAELAGCYEVRELNWNPPDNRINLIPPRFRLSTNRTQPGHDVFSIESVPVNDSPLARFSFWIPGDNELRISFGTGFGGFRGTLKPSSTGELEGKLKEWCDNRCEWKKRVGTIHARRIECSQ